MNPLKTFLQQMFGDDDAPSLKTPRQPAEITATLSLGEEETKLTVTARSRPPTDDEIIEHNERRRAFERQRDLDDAQQQAETALTIAQAAGNASVPTDGN